MARVVPLAFLLLVFHQGQLAWTWTYGWLQADARVHYCDAEIVGEVEILDEGMPLGSMSRVVLPLKGSRRGEMLCITSDLPPARHFVFLTKVRGNHLDSYPLSSKERAKLESSCQDWYMQTTYPLLLDEVTWASKASRDAPRECYRLETRSNIELSPLVARFPIEGVDDFVLVRKDDIVEYLRWHRCPDEWEFRTDYLPGF